MHQQLLLQQAEHPAFSLPSTPLWSSDLLKYILLLYMNFCHHSFLPHYHLHHREHKNSHKIPQEMQKIYIKLQSGFCLSSSALCKFLKLLGEENSGYTMEGGNTWTETSNDHPYECPKPAWMVSQAANFIHGLYHEPLHGCTSAYNTRMDGVFVQ